MVASTARGPASGPSRTRVAVKSWLQAAGLDEAARACRRALSHAGRQAGGIDRHLLTDYLAAEPRPRLHIGCGTHTLDGWLNADHEPHARSVLCLDATRPFPLPSNRFDAVFSEHMIEHVPQPGGAAMLRECRRVLKPGGRVRITTPDLAFVLDLYNPMPTPLQQDYLRWSAAVFVRGAPVADPVFVINNFVRAWGHQFIYDERTLRQAMAAAGFVGIERRPLHESDEPLLCGLENLGRMPEGFLALESFTLEGVKPVA